MIMSKNTVESRFSKLQGTSYNPGLECWKKNPPFLHFNVALEIVSIDCVDNPNTERVQQGNFPEGYSPHGYVVPPGS